MNVKLSLTGLDPAPENPELYVVAVVAAAQHSTDGAGGVGPRAALSVYSQETDGEVKALLFDGDPGEWLVVHGHVMTRGKVREDLGESVNHEQAVLDGNRHAADRILGQAWLGAGSAALDVADVANGAMEALRRAGDGLVQSFALRFEAYQFGLGGKDKLLASDARGTAKFTLEVSGEPVSRETGMAIDSGETVPADGGIKPRDLAPGEMLTSAPDITGGATSAGNSAATSPVVPGPGPAEPPALPMTQAPTLAPQPTPDDAIPFPGDSGNGRSRSRKTADPAS